MTSAPAMASLMSARFSEALSRPYSYYCSVAREIAPHIRRTATVQPVPLRERGLGEVWVKEECLQVTGAFKVRGGLRAVGSLTPAQRQAGIICPTAGNGGAGLAYAAAREGVATYLVLPETAPEAAAIRLRSYGPTVRLLRHGRNWDEACALARQIAEEQDLTFIHPFDSLAFVDGAATLAVELLEDLPNISSVVVPVGGGGLLAGICLALAAAGTPVRIQAVEPEGAASLHHSLAANSPVSLESVSTAATTLAVRQVGELGFAAARFGRVEVTLVSDDEIEQALAFALDKLHLVVEPAGAASLAAVLAGKVVPATGPLAVLLTGGQLTWADGVRALRRAGLLPGAGESG